VGASRWRTALANTTSPPWPALRGKTSVTRLAQWRQQKIISQDTQHYCLHNVAALEREEEQS
jgi:hypothetical protein